MTEEGEEDWESGGLNLRREVIIRTNGRALRIRQDKKSSECGAVCWEVSVIFAKLLDAGALPCVRDLQGRWCLELGSGCGLGGMALAAHGCHVVFTDIPALIPHLTENVQRNGFPSDIVGYDWTGAMPTKLNMHFDIILATDCVYHAHLVDPFLQALRSVATSKSSTVLLIYERRDPDVLSRFEADLKASFKVKSINLPRLRRFVPEVLDRLLDRDDDRDWLTILECRRRKNK